MLISLRHLADLIQTVQEKQGHLRFRLLYVLCEYFVKILFACTFLEMDVLEHSG
jgi:hypothetical protein